MPKDEDEVKKGTGKTDTEVQRESAFTSLDEFFKKKPQHGNQKQREQDNCTAPPNSIDAPMVESDDEAAAPSSKNPEEPPYGGPDKDDPRGPALKK